MKVVVIGNGPIGALITSVLERDNWETVLVATGLHKSRERNARITQGRLHPLPNTTVDISLAGVLQKRPEAIVIAQPAWIAESTLLALRPLLGKNQVPLYLSSNGFWWPRENEPLTAIRGAISVTSFVSFTRDGILVEAPGSGFLLSPADVFLSQFAHALTKADLPSSFATSGISAVASKVIVNVPLSLQYGLGTGTIDDLLRDSATLLNEACQLCEIGQLFEQAHIDLSDVPGFDIGGLLRLASEHAEDMKINRRTGRDPSPFADALRRWRLGRNPTLGTTIRENKPQARLEVDWIWNRLLHLADILPCPMPATSDLVARFRARGDE